MGQILKSIKLTGSVPSKKNTWRRSARGGLYIPADIKAELDALLWQLKKHKPAKPITCMVRIDMQFYTRYLRKDKDGMATTINDLLQKAEILKNDRQDNESYSTRVRGIEDIVFVDIFESDL